MKFRKTGDYLLKNQISASYRYIAKNLAAWYFYVVGVIWNVVTPKNKLIAG